MVMHSDSIKFYNDTEQVEKLLNKSLKRSLAMTNFHEFLRMEKKLKTKYQDPPNNSDEKYMTEILDDRFGLLVYPESNHECEVDELKKLAMKFNVWQKVSNCPLPSEEFKKRLENLLLDLSVPVEFEKELRNQLKTMPASSGFPSKLDNLQKAVPQPLGLAESFMNQSTPQGYQYTMENLQNDSSENPELELKLVNHGTNFFPSPGFVDQTDSQLSGLSSPSKLGDSLEYTSMSTSKLFGFKTKSDICNDNTLSSPDMERSTQTYSSLPSGFENALIKQKSMSLIPDFNKMGGYSKKFPSSLELKINIDNRHESSIRETDSDIQGLNSTRVDTPVEGWSLKSNPANNQIPVDTITDCAEIVRPETGAKNKVRAREVRYNSPSPKKESIHRSKVHEWVSSDGSEDYSVEYVRHLLAASNLQNSLEELSESSEREVGVIGSKVESGYWTQSGLTSQENSWPQSRDNSPVKFFSDKIFNFENRDEERPNYFNRAVTLQITENKNTASPQLIQPNYVSKFFSADNNKEKPRSGELCDTNDVQLMSIGESLSQSNASIPTEKVNFFDSTNEQTTKYSCKDNNIAIEGNIWNDTKLSFSSNSKRKLAEQKLVDENLDNQDSKTVSIYERIEEFFADEPPTSRVETKPFIECSSSSEILQNTIISKIRSNELEKYNFGSLDICDSKFSDHSIFPTGSSKYPLYQPNCNSEFSSPRNNQLETSFSQDRNKIKISIPLLTPTPLPANPTENFDCGKPESIWQSSNLFQWKNQSSIWGAGISDSNKDWSIQLNDHADYPSQFSNRSAAANNEIQNLWSSKSNINRDLKEFACSTNDRLYSDLGSLDDGDDDDDDEDDDGDEDIDTALIADWVDTEVNFEKLSNDSESGSCGDEVSSSVKENENELENVSDSQSNFCQRENFILKKDLRDRKMLTGMNSTLYLEALHFTPQKAKTIVKDENYRLFRRTFYKNLTFSYIFKEQPVNTMMKIRSHIALLYKCWALSSRRFGKALSSLSGTVNNQSCMKVNRTGEMRRDSPSVTFEFVPPCESGEVVCSGLEGEIVLLKSSCEVGELNQSCEVGELNQSCPCEVGELEQHCEVGELEQSCEVGELEQSCEVGELEQSCEVGELEQSCEVGELEQSCEVGELEQSCEVGELEQSCEVGELEQSCEVGELEQSCEVGELEQSCEVGDFKSFNVEAKSSGGV